MPCRIGITTDPEDRRRYWQGQHPRLRNWTIVKSGLTQRQAQAEEERLAARHNCVAHAGGPKIAGRKWSVYRFDY